MAEIVVEIFARVVLEAVAVVITGAIREGIKEHRSKKSIVSSQKQNRSPTKHNRAVLIVTSNITFGNDCERLVNIAFKTSQTFPNIMGKYADVHRYLCEELAKHYPNEKFHIIIGQNEKFGFSIDDGQYSAEIKQDRYNVLIFTTKQNSNTKFDTHDANSQMLFKWN
ncbi:unnamed protein product [Adineta steineri]|uniref:Uncharacterized protein n=1 Tax=Adineta steineri TaxID=433720 RepID=A0A818PMU5_9BILA|nr:unnamed protein product [Adineta steineri]CAF3625981.1 unnamed protein product [Adineta steineri]